MSENKEINENKKISNNNNSYISAVDLAKMIVDTTSTLLGTIDAICNDAEAMAKAKQVLTELQKKAYDYLYRSAKRSQTNTRRRYKSWRGKAGKKRFY